MEFIFNLGEIIKNISYNIMLGRDNRNKEKWRRGEGNIRGWGVILYMVDRKGIWWSNIWI